MLARLAAFCYRRRWRVLIAWIVVLIGVNVLAQTVGGDLLKTFSLPGTESQRAFDVLKQDFNRKGDTGNLVFRVRGDGDVHSPAVQREVESVVAELRKQPHVVSITTPYDRAGARFISTRDPKIAYAEILFDLQSNDVPVKLSEHMRSVVKDANSSQIQFELGGYMFTDQTQPSS